MRGFIHVFLLFICLFPVSLAAQDRVTLSGEVRGEDGAPLPMVTVAIENTTAGTYTDDRGALFTKSETRKAYSYNYLVGL